MGVAQTSSVALLFFVGIAMPFANAGIGRGGKFDDRNLEARGECSAGACLGNLDAPGASQLKSLLHKISIFDEDDRVYQVKRGKGIGFAPIGGIVANQAFPNPDYNPRDPKSGPKVISSAASSGVLVSPCHVLTNYHAIAGSTAAPAKGDRRAEEKFAKTYTANFYVGADGNDLYEVKGKPVKWGMFGPSKPVEEDWVLLELENCVGLDQGIGWMEMDVDATAGNAARNMQVAMAGYPGDRDTTQLSLDPSCKLRGSINNNQVLEHTCANRPGASGSPIFYLDEDNVPYMVGLNRGSRRPAEGEGKLNLDPEKDVIPSSNPASARYISYAVNIPKIYGEIKSEINAAKNQFKKENPVLAQLKGNGSKVAVPENVPLREKVSPRKKTNGKDI